MIKRTLTILPLLLVFGSAWAQDTTRTEKPRRMLEHQIGLNATRFIQTFINFSGVPLDNTEFDINYKGFYILPDNYFFKKLGLRTAIGHVNTTSEFSNGNGASGTDDRQVNFRVGIELQKRIDKRWTFYGGADYVTSDAERVTKSTFFSGGQSFTTTTVESFKAEGFGPVLGIQFDINRHLCLSTEATMYFIKGTGKSTTTSDHPSFTPQWNNSKEGSSSIVLPAFINFSFKF